MTFETRPRARSELRVGSATFDLDRRMTVMAIVNRTPDSFYDRGSTFVLDPAIAAGAAAVADGADFIDVGGVTFAPGPALPIPDEIARVIPVVRELAALAPVSVDTFHPEVAQAAIEAGATIINDTTGLRSAAMADVVASGGATLVIAHSLAARRTRFPQPHYDDVALSNKDFVGETLARDRGDRVAGSITAAVLCALKGARIVRTHNVRPTVDARRMLEALLGWREPAYLVHNMRPEGND